MRTLNSVTEGERMLWNEEQQMVSDSNAQGVHHYVYDYKGERMMKSSFVVTQTWKDGNILDTAATLEAYTVYRSEAETPLGAPAPSRGANPYLVSSYFDNGSTIENRSTQHYYMGMQRVASGLFAKQALAGPGPGGGGMKTTATQDGKVVLDQLEGILQDLGYEAGNDYTRTELEQPVSMAEAYRSAAEIPLGAPAPSRDPEYASQKDKDSLTETMSLLGPGELCEGVTTEVYWYHPNYLGSVDLVTDKDGLVHQFFLYTLWGESMYMHNAQTQGFDSPYRFNGKELDPETGLHYYGARYYQNRLSVWLSVDPLAYRYPNMSPYVFTGNNPIFFIDSDGRSIDPSSDEAAGFILDGTSAVLGDKSPFYYDKESKQIRYNEYNREDFTEEQLELIDKYVSLIDDSEKHHVHAVDRDEKFLYSDPIYNSVYETSLEKLEYNGATVGNTSWIARDPVEKGSVMDVNNPDFDISNPTYKPGLVPSSDPIGINGIHELGGHQWENRFNANATPNTRNTNTTDFETRMRQIYQIGVHSWWSALWSRSARRGDPRYLKGKGSSHPTRH